VFGSVLVRLLHGCCTFPEDVTGERRSISNITSAHRP
jgi:hypothetical protein